MFVYQRTQEASFLRTEQSRMNAKILTIASAFVAFMMVAGPVSVSAQTPDAAAPAATEQAAPAPDANAPAGEAPSTGTATVENPYGLQALIRTGDFVSH